MQRQGVRTQLWSNLSPLPEHLHALMQEVMIITSSAVQRCGRQELVNAAWAIAQQVVSDTLSLDVIVASFGL